MLQVCKSMILSRFAKMKLYYTDNVLRKGSVVLQLFEKWQVNFPLLFNMLLHLLFLQDKEIRERLQDSEYKLGFSMPLEEAKERATQLQSEITLLER